MISFIKRSFYLPLFLHNVAPCVKADDELVDRVAKIPALELENKFDEVYAYIARPVIAVTDFLVVEVTRQGNHGVRNVPNAVPRRLALEALSSFESRLKRTLTVTGNTMEFFQHQIPVASIKDGMFMVLEKEEKVEDEEEKVENEEEKVEDEEEKVEDAAKTKVVLKPSVLAVKPSAATFHQIQFILLTTKKIEESSQKIVLNAVDHVAINRVLANLSVKLHTGFLIVGSNPELMSHEDRMGAVFLYSLESAKFEVKNTQIEIMSENLFRGAANTHKVVFVPLGELNFWIAPYATMADTFFKNEGQIDLTDLWKTGDAETIHLSVLSVRAVNDEKDFAFAFQMRKMTGVPVTMNRVPMKTSTSQTLTKNCAALRLGGSSPLVRFFGTKKGYLSNEKFQSLTSDSVTKKLETLVVWQVGTAGRHAKVAKTAVTLRAMSSLPLPEQPAALDKSF